MTPITPSMVTYSMVFSGGLSGSSTCSTRSLVSSAMSLCWECDAVKLVGMI